MPQPNAPLVAQPSKSSPVNTREYTGTATPTRPGTPLNPHIALQKVSSLNGRTVPLGLTDSDATSLLQIDPGIMRSVRWVRFAADECINGLRNIIGKRRYDRHMLHKQGEDKDGEDYERLAQVQGRKRDKYDDYDEANDKIAACDVPRPTNPMARCRLLSAEGEEIPLGANPALASFGTFDDSDSPDDAFTTRNRSNINDGERIPTVVATKFMLSAAEARALCSTLREIDETDEDAEWGILSRSTGPTRTNSTSSLSSLVAQNLAFLAIENPDAPDNTPDNDSDPDHYRALALFRSARSRPATPYAFITPVDDDEAVDTNDEANEDASHKAALRVSPTSPTAIPELVPDDGSDGTGSDMSLSPTDTSHVDEFGMLQPDHQKSPDPCIFDGF